MTLLDKIHQAKTKTDLDILQMEIILDREHFAENKRAFIEKLRKLDDGRKAHT